MKAIRCQTYGPPSNLKLEEIDSLHAGPKEVVVQVKACGLNFPDTLIIEPDLNQAIANVEIILIAVPSHAFRETLKNISASLQVFKRSYIYSNLGQSLAML